MFLLKIILISLTLIISGCSGNKNDDFDLSNLKLPIKKSKELNKSNIETIDKKNIINKLIPLKDRNKLLTDITYGKDDPFSALDKKSNNFNLNLQLKGFISIENKNYALVKFNNAEGIVNINSIGGLNTKLLPNKASIINIDPEQELFSFEVEGSIYKFKLNE